MTGRRSSCVATTRRRRSENAAPITLSRSPTDASSPDNSSAVTSLHDGMPFAPRTTCIENGATEVGLSSVLLANDGAPCTQHRHRRPSPHAEGASTPPASGLWPTMPCCRAGAAAVPALPAPLAAQASQRVSRSAHLAPSF
eukprot:240341-Chlamydomonas_euryale.AAC.12